MKKVIIIPLFLGSCAGAFYGGYLYSKTKYEKQAQEDINNYKESLKRKEIENVPAGDSESPDQIAISHIDNSGNFQTIIRDYSPDVSAPIKEKESKQAKNNAIKKQERKENKYSRKHIDYDPIDELYPDEEPPGPSDDGQDPYGITYEEYCENNYHYTKEVLIYYEDSDALVYDETNECIYDDACVVGYDWRNEIGKHVTDMAYIRNDNNSTDYEIIVKHCKYEEEENSYYDED